MPGSFDLDRYLARIGLDVAPPADESGLAIVHAAQVIAIPFENLDIVLGRGIDVDPSAVFEKLVNDERGGYCFECNTLLCDALAALGFDVRIRLGRVIFERADGPIPARTHAVVEVRIGDASWVVDAGFGAHTPRAPLPLIDGATAGDGEASPGGWVIRADPEHRWRLLRVAPDRDALDLYVFDEALVYESDLKLGNHWTSTHPTASFTQRVIAVRHRPSGRVVLRGQRLTEYVGSEAREHVLDSPEALKDAIGRYIGLSIPLTSHEAARLWELGNEG